MRRLTIFLALAALSCACSEDTDEVCGELLDRWNGLAAQAPTQCTRDDECTFIGGPIEPTCQDVAHLPMHPIRRDAVDAELGAVGGEFSRRCAGYNVRGNLAPPETGCDPSGRCFIEDRFCGAPPDASPDAAPDASDAAP